VHPEHLEITVLENVTVSTNHAVLKTACVPLMDVNVDIVCTAINENKIHQDMKVVIKVVAINVTFEISQ
jgi:hypothetical protein